MTREEWLNMASQRIAARLAELQLAMPVRYRVTCGWPSKKAISRKSARIGEAWPRGASSDDTAEIFISPVLDDALEVLATLAHELCHVADENKSGHRKPFQKLAAGIGLTGPWTSSVPGPEFERWSSPVITDLGPYPHAAINPSLPMKKQGTRLHKVVCHQCGYTVRVTQKWIDVGFPTCPCGGDMEQEA
jgi:hypothetical protein